MTLLKYIIFLLSLRYFLNECPIAAQTTALVDVEIIKQIKIKINSSKYENLFCINIAELDMETLTALGFIN